MTSAQTLLAVQAVALIWCALARSPPYFPRPLPPRRLNCGPNEGTLGCDIKCETLLRPYQVACMPFYAGKCVCKPGFYRTKQGQCVRKEDCPEVQCPEGSSWQQCVTVCDKGPRCDGAPCFQHLPLRPCRPGCKCDGGYKVNKEGQCVKPEQCPPPPSCPTNQTYDPCVSCEEGTCEDFPIVCAFGCLRQGCVCEAGFVRNGDGQCVRKADCSATKCPPNEVYKTCGSRCGEPKCKPPREPLACPAVCERGCFCRDKYARDESGVCKYKGLSSSC